MRDADRFKLLGSYRTPRVRLGTVLSDEVRDDDVVVVGYSDGRIPWPVGRRRGFRGRGGLVVYGGLAEAVRREANQAVAFWWGVTQNTVSLWRQALDVKSENQGTHSVRRGYGAEEWFAGVRAKGRAARWTEERRAELSAQFKGRKYSPAALANIRAGLNESRRASLAGSSVQHRASGEHYLRAFHGARGPRWRPMAQKGDRSENGRASRTARFSGVSAYRPRVHCRHRAAPRRGSKRG
jgi:hypothetical protein